MARIGFDPVLYGTNEEFGFVTVTVRLLDGILSDDVIVTLTTEEDFAIGELCTHVCRLSSLLPAHAMPHACTYGIAMLHVELASLFNPSSQGQPAKCL